MDNPDHIRTTYLTETLLNRSRLWLWLEHRWKTEPAMQSSYSFVFSSTTVSANRNNYQHQHPLTSRIRVQPIIDHIFAYFWSYLHDRVYGIPSVTSSSSSITVPLSVAKVSQSVTLTIEEVYTFYFPLLLYFFVPTVIESSSCSTTSSSSCQIYGIIGAAGAGKSTLACILVQLGNYLYPFLFSTVTTPAMTSGTATEATAPLDNLKAYALSLQPSLASTSSSSSFLSSTVSIQTLSMDAYHYPNDKLDALNLRAQKGAIHTIDAEALAYDICYAKYYDYQTHAIDVTKLALLPGNVSKGQVIVESNSSASSLLWYPEYDRSDTHNPLLHQVPVTKDTRIILLEGLYLCSSASASWSCIRSLCTEVFALDIPLQECAARVIARKIRTANYTYEAAEQHFIKVDLPVWHSLQKDMLQCLPAGPNHICQIVPDNVTIKNVPNNTESKENEQYSPWKGILSQRRAPVTLNSWEKPTVTSKDTCDSLSLSTNRKGMNDSGGEPSILVLGLNPCIQSTLLFGPVEVEKVTVDDQSCTKIFRSLSSQAMTTKSYWQRGEVNRASYNSLTVGGKGQHTLLAILRHGNNIARNKDKDHHSNYRVPYVYLAQFLGNYNGEQVLNYLRHQLRSFDGIEPTIKNTPSSEKSDTFALRPLATLSSHAISLTVDIGTFASTRTCTTLIDSHPLMNDMTELVGPSNTLPLDFIDSMRQTINRWMDEQFVVGAKHQLQGIALCGTVPPGAETLYEDTLRYYYSSLLSSNSSSSSLKPFTIPILLDCVKNVVPLLLANYITIIKINVEEVYQLYNDLVKAVGTASVPTTVDNFLYSSSFESSPFYSSQHPTMDSRTTNESNERQRKLHILNTVMRIFTLLGTCIHRKGTNDTVTETVYLRLRYIAVTDGPSVAYLFEYSSASSSSSSSEVSALPRLFRVYEYYLPSLDDILYRMNIIDKGTNPFPKRTVLYNPIGAGDTVTGVFLGSLVTDPSVSYVAAFGNGLSAGSASCCTLYGAEYTYGIQRCIQENMVINEWALYI